MKIETILVEKKYLKSLSHNDLEKYLRIHFNQLVGSQLFSIGKTWLTKTIQFITKRDAKGDFLPTHVGQIIKVGTTLFIVNVTPPKVVYVELLDYIENTQEEFKILMRGHNFKLDPNKYTYEVSSLIGQEYGYLSAIQSGIKCLHWLPNRKMHCSEACVKYLQNQGYFKGVKADNMTPVQVFYQMIDGSF